MLLINSTSMPPNPVHLSMGLRTTNLFVADLKLDSGQTKFSYVSITSWDSSQFIFQLVYFQAQLIFKNLNVNTPCVLLQINKKISNLLKVLAFL